MFAALIEADLWVEPPVVEQLFLIESTRAELEWPVEAAPSLVIFESDQPQFYSGDLGDTEAVLAWLRQFVPDNADPASEVEASGDTEDEVAQ